MNTNNVIWKPVYHNNKITNYLVSNSGKVKNTTSNKLLAGHLNEDGYIIFNLTIENKRCDYKAHRLVALSFIPNPENKPEVNHKDGNKQNNWDWNIEWVTRKENIQHAYDTGLMKNSMINRLGSKNPSSKYSEEQVESVCKYYFIDNKTQKEIAEKLNVSIDFIKTITSRRNWRHISSKYILKNIKPMPKNRRFNRMAKKKDPTIEDAVKDFKDTVTRASLSNYFYVNNVIISKNNYGNTILVIPEQELLVKLFEDEEWKKETNLREPDITKADEANLSSHIEYAKDLEIDWFPIDIDADLYTGKVFKIKINDYEYKISINRDLMPMKLKKTEYEGVGYKVFLKPSQVLAIKKKFEGIVEGGGFTIIRLFQII